MKATKPLFKRPAFILSLITAVFLIPLLAAWFLEAKGLPLTEKTTNHGQLIQPPFNFGQLNASDKTGKTIDTKQWKGRWVLLYANVLHCDGDCEKHLFFLHQLHIATGKDSERVKNAVLDFTDQPRDPQFENFLSQHLPYALHLNTTYKNYVHFIAHFPNASAALKQGMVYLIDPHGNVFMVYPDDAPPMDIFHDLTHLLKISHIG